MSHDVPSPPASRWYCDRGAIPGEPLAYLDVPHESLRYASAILVEEDTGDPDAPAYHAILGHPADLRERRPEELSPLFPTLREAQEWAELRVSAPQGEIPLEIQIEEAIARTYRPQTGEVLILITEPGRTPVTPFGTFAAVYQLAAWDIPHTIHHATHGVMNSLSIEDAAALLDFVLRHRHSMSKLVISCTAGVARSPGVAIALSEWLPTRPHIYELIEQHPCFHRPIYRTLCQVALAHGLLLP